MIKFLTNLSILPPVKKSLLGIFLKHILYTPQIL
jgi:hypothetical protein